eukprot:TRINITY_DN1660_c0_g1_i2.p1 TRINITY_DN1660_c0_g1~~TRINITY_DN1660_c0_g1_i2.p1  ORF type:complete len:888 (-),score=159.27 TRINITY_DN1660_c0_g1_i2:4-2667(-)
MDSSPEASPQISPRRNTVVSGSVIIQSQRGGAAILTPQKPPGAPGQPETPQDRRTKIALEILHTERNYVSSLQELLKDYEQPLQSFAKSVSPPESKVTLEGVKSIFGSLPSLLPLNAELLAQLERRIEGWNEESIVGDIFLTIAPFLKMYKEYENNYDKALNLLTDYMADLGFAKAVEDIERVSNVRIEGVLIMPIQRIPRYPLLLGDMLRHTPKEHKDYPLLQKALTMVEEVANSLDKDLHAHEQRQRYVELAVAVGAENLLMAHRRFLKEGELPLIGAGANRLHLFLFNDILVPYSQSAINKFGGEKWMNHKKAVIARPENQWPLELVWINDIESTEKEKNVHKFEIVGPSRSYTVKLASAEEKSSWLKAFQEAMESCPNMVRDETNKLRGPKRFGAHTFKNKTRYTGEWLSGQIDGFGEMDILGNMYKGNFSQNKRKGTGRLVYHTGEVYEGEWSLDLQNGAGIMTYPNGDKYDGGWKAGKRSSKGKMTYSNGDVYSGNWEENLPQGQGTLTCVNGVTYQGGWHHGQFHNKGTLNLPNGCEYKGEWSHGERDGLGTLMQYADPSQKTIVIMSYRGIWRKGMKAEQGILDNLNGKYDGEFANDFMEGQGTMEYRDGSRFIGQWKRDRREGVGIWMANNPRARIQMYDGEWKDDRREGKGKVLLSNNDSYDGGFKHNLFHGPGVYTRASGEKIEGKWVRDVLVGPANFVLKPPQTAAGQPTTAPTSNSIPVGGEIPPPPSSNFMASASMGGGTSNPALSLGAIISGSLGGSSESLNSARYHQQQQQQPSSQPTTSGGSGSGIHSSNSTANTSNSNSTSSSTSGSLANSNNAGSSGDDSTPGGAAAGPASANVLNGTAKDSILVAGKKVNLPFAPPPAVLQFDIRLV